MERRETFSTFPTTWTYPNPYNMIHNHNKKLSTTVLVDTIASDSGQNKFSLHRVRCENISAVSQTQPLLTPNSLTVLCHSHLSYPHLPCLLVFKSQTCKSPLYCIPCLQTGIWWSQRLCSVWRPGSPAHSDSLPSPSEVAVLAVS